jgi:RNAse (barnase) inhibitor barstar
MTTTGLSGEFGNSEATGMYEIQLKSADRCGIYHLPSTRRSILEKTAGRLGLQLLKADFSVCRNTAEALRQLGSALHFPAWYGANLDALFDCLTDPDWLASRGTVVLIGGADSLQQAAPEDFSILIEVLQAASDTHRETATPCWILLDAPAPGISTLPEA